MLFSTQPAFIQIAVTAGVRGVVLDWEHRGKEGRQASADTEINRDTLDDLARVRACTDALIVCRVHGFDFATPDEIESAIEAGADEILLPMVRSVEEVEEVLARVGNRCGVGILIETVKAIAAAKELGQLPLSRVYVGLNDLAIERGTPSIFTALADGTLERVREVTEVPFGFGGLTLPECGHPIPCRLLIAEMARLRCDFSFLRRSFYRDMRGRDLAGEVPRIIAALDAAGRRPEEVVAEDRRELRDAVQSLQPVVFGSP